MTSPLPASPNTDGSPSRAVDKVMDVLLAFLDAPQGLRLTDVAQRLGMHPSTASRLLASLASRHLLQRDAASQRYEVGPALMALASSPSTDTDLRALVREPMVRLRDATEETVSLQVGFGLHRFCAEVVEGIHDLRRVARVGRLEAIHRGSSGRAILAFLDDDRRGAILDGLADDDLPAGGRATLDAWLATIRARGYSISAEEVVPGIVGLSYPVFDHTGTVQASLSISFPMFRHHRDDVERRAGALLPLAAEASRAAGHPGAYPGT